jgi:HSP20 family protein
MWGTNPPDSVLGGWAKRRARAFGQFDRTISIPVKLDPGGIKAEYHEGVLALFLPRAESDKPRSVKIK